MEAKIIQIGNALGILLPKETLEHMNAGAGDVLHLTESPDGLCITPHDPAVEVQMVEARAIMKNRRSVLRELAK